ncbi:WhiB family transcriptional regulator [Cellulomonas sp. APG4]|uniref:WhiB family transcriptional regulator n=1 Tax=Cellulomonas sp. APG4 TaxID=1538656 RepID=UPI00137B5A42|nr:WhiB family transcriptional regulator [Cellulomonas sp. APG4]NCT90140.1 WhiB family transcriptional regulator [Cellulomonas sp. APG4]
MPSKSAATTPFVATTWQLRAACRDADGDWDIEPKGHPSPANVLALAVCESCPVREACLDFAVATEGAWPRWGIWGGELPWERERITRVGRGNAD